MGNFFGGGGSGSAPTRYAGIQVSTSIMGQVIPLVMGRNRVPMNLMWYGNFVSTPVKNGGKGGGGAGGSFSYSASWQAGLCLGPIVGIISVWSDKTQTTLTYENLTVALGAIGQPVWSGYPVGTPANQQIPYSSTAWVGSQDFILGDSPAMPNFTYELEGAVAGFSDAHGMFDCDPPAIITAYLTNPVWGAGFTGTIAPMTGATNTYQAWCGALGIFLSPVEDNQRSATDFIAETMQITNSDIVLSCGTLNVIPYADAPVSGTTPDGTTWSYAPNLTPVFQFTDADYFPKVGEDPVMLDRKASTDLYNIVTVGYLDRANLYNPQPAFAPDNYDISIRGPKQMPALSFRQITQASVARTVAQLILQFQLYERNTYTFRVRWPFSLVEPMDYIGITEARLGLVNQVCRVIETQDDENNEFTVKCMKVTGTIRTSAQFSFAGSQGYYANFGVAPPSVDSPAIFLMPAIPASLSEGFTIGVCASNPTGTTNWGGARVNLSLDGGTTYSEIGTIGNFGPGNYGTLTSNLGVHADPDTVSSFGIVLDNTANQISTAVTHANADAMLTLALIGSGSNTEVIAYGSATLTGPGAYTLSYLRRGLYGTTPLANTAGARFVNIDGAVFEFALDPGQAGQTINLKFQSFNSVGAQTQDLSACTAYSYTLPDAVGAGGVATLIARGSCALTDQTAYKATTAANSFDSDCITTAAYSSVSISAQYSSGKQMSVALLTSNTLGTSTQVGSHPFIGIFINTIANTVQVYAQGFGIWNTNTANVKKNDLFQVIYDSFTFRFYWNGVLLTSYPVQGLSVYAAVQMETPGCVFSNVEVNLGALATPAQFVASGNCVVNDTNALKQGGAAAWDSAVYSVIGYQTCHITAKANLIASAAGRFMAGLSSNPVPLIANVTGGILYVQLDYAWFNGGPGNWQIYEAGTAVYTGAPPAVTDVVSVTYDGATVTYYLNGVSVRTVSIAALTLYGMCVFFDPDAGLNSLRFGPSTSLALPITGGAALLSARGTCILNGQMVSKPAGTNAWDGDAVSAQAYGAGAIQAQYKVTGANGVQAFGFISAIPGSATLQPDSGAGNGYFGIYVHGPSTLVVVEDGVTAYTSGSAPANNDLYLVTYDGFSLRYYINGVLVWTTVRQLGPLYFITSFFAPGTAYAFVDLQLTTSAQSTPTQFVATGDAVISDSHVSKPTGGAAWDASAYSVLGFPICHVSAKPNMSVTDNCLVGLSSQPSASPSYVNANYGWLAGTGTWNIYEAGTFVTALSAISLQDIAAITYDGSTITYLLNGAVQRTVSVSGLILFGFFSLDSPLPAGGFNSINFGPTTNLAVIDTAQVGLNAATSVLTTTVASPPGAPATGAFTIQASITVGPFKYVTTSVVTVTAMYDNSSLVKTNQLNYGISTTGTGFTNGNLITVPALASAAADATGLIGHELTFSLAANTTQTYYFNASVPSGPATGIGISNLNMKVESIVR